MKSTELFDLLGEIDDKFYEEARIPDEQYGVEIVSEHRPFRGFMSIFMPIAACVVLIAAVAVGANFIQRNAGLVYPNDSDSELSSDAPLIEDRYVPSTSTSTSTKSEASTTSSASIPPEPDDKEIRLEDYPPIDFDNIPVLSGGGLETQVSHQDEKLQKATLETLKCGDYDLNLLGRYIYVNDPTGDRLYCYYLTLAVSKDGKVISSDSTHTASVSMGQGGYILHRGNMHWIAEEGGNECLKYYELNGADLVIFRYNPPVAGGNDEHTFFTVTDDGELRLLMGDCSGIGGSSMEACVSLDDYTVDTQANTLTSGDKVYTFNVENFGLNPYDAVHYTTSIAQFDLSEYPVVESSEIPDIGGDFYDTTNALPKATISQIKVGDYTLSLIGKNVRKQVSKVIAEEVCSVISRDGRIIRFTHENGTGVRTLTLDEYELVRLLPDAYLMNDGIVFGLDKKSVSHTGTPSFGTIRNDVMFEFAPPVLGNDERDPYDGIVAEATGKVTVIAEENTLIIDSIKYVFDFDTITYSDTVTADVNIGDYTAFDDNALGKTQSHVILDVKQAGEYKFYLLGNYVTEKPAEEFPIVDFDKLYIVAEKDGKKIAQITADNYDLNGLKLTEYLHPFEMKDGKGFIMYYDLDPWGGQYQYAMIYKLKNDKITKLTYEYDYAPAPATGSPHYVGSDFGIDYDNNAIIVGDNKLTLDFNQNVFSETAREI